MPRCHTGSAAVMPVGQKRCLDPTHGIEEMLKEYLAIGPARILLGHAGLARFGVSEWVVSDLVKEATRISIISLEGLYACR